jgi:hypothetical protein
MTPIHMRAGIRKRGIEQMPGNQPSTPALAFLFRRQVILDVDRHRTTPSAIVE